MAYEIRTMKEEDWPEVSRIFSTAIEGGRATFRTECPSLEKWDAGHHPDCRFVILLEGQIAGWCAIGPTSSIETYWGVVEESIYLDEAYRGKGLGTALLRHLCAESEKAGYWCLYAVIIATNTQSIHLHEKCGFRTIGYREKPAKDRFGTWLDTVVMERRNGIR